MATWVRLDARTHSVLERLAKERGQSKTELSRVALKALTRKAAKADTCRGTERAYDRIAHVVGIADSRGARLSQRTGERFRELLIRHTRGRRSR